MHFSVPFFLLLLSKYSISKARESEPTNRASKSVNTVDLVSAISCQSPEELDRSWYMCVRVVRTWEWKCMQQHSFIRRFYTLRGCHSRTSDIAWFSHAPSFSVDFSASNKSWQALVFSGQYIWKPAERFLYARVRARRFARFFCNMYINAYILIPTTRSQW